MVNFMMNPTTPRLKISFSRSVQTCTCRICSGRIAFGPDRKRSTQMQLTAWLMTVATAAPVTPM